jgi:DNA-binding PadR family transcriptional regulator
VSISPATAKSSPLRAPFAVPVVLGLLSEGPLHGYAVHSRIRDDLRGILHLPMNRLYALLRDMEASGLITGWDEQPSARPARRIFALSADGHSRFERWMREPCRAMREMRIDFPPKLYFALRRGPRDVAELVQTQRVACAAEIERITALPAADDFHRAVYELRLGQLRAALVWLDALPSLTAADTMAPRNPASKKPGTS